MKNIEIVTGISKSARRSPTEVRWTVGRPGDLKRGVRQIAGPPSKRRHVGGNVANGSPQGGQRVDFLRDRFNRGAGEPGQAREWCHRDSTGRGKTCLMENECDRIVMPLKNVELLPYKGGAPRGALAIARVSFTGLMRVEGGIILHVETHTARWPGIIRRPDFDGMMIGARLEEARRSGRITSRRWPGHRAHRGRISDRIRKRCF